MPDLSLASPTSFRLVAAAAAAVGSLALVALGVQIGTDGLGDDDAARNRAAAAASRSPAVVDLGRVRPAGPLVEPPRSLVADVGPETPSTSPAPSPSAPAAPGPGPSPAPAPEPAPLPPVAPAPAPELPEAPVAPGLPDPAPLLAPLAPVVDPIVGTVVDPLIALAAPAPSEPTTSDQGAMPALTGLLGL